MSRTLRATLEDGRTLEYLAEPAGEGSMKTVHFTPDRSSVVCFFKEKSAAQDPERRRRLQAIVGRYNPTTDPATGAYWRELFCWPTGVLGLNAGLMDFPMTYPGCSEGVAGSCCSSGPGCGS